MQRLIIAFAFVAVAACASSASKPSRPEPEVLLTQTSNIGDAARNVTGALPVRYRLAIHNTTPGRLVLKRADLQSIGMGAYNLPSLSRGFDVSIDVGETKAFDLWGSAVIDDPTIMGANGPVTIRAILHFDSADGQFQAVSVQQVHATPSSD